MVKFCVHAKAFMLSSEAWDHCLRQGAGLDGPLVLFCYGNSIVLSNCANEISKHNIQIAFDIYTVSYVKPVKQHGQCDSCRECAWVTLDMRKTISELGLQPSAHSRIWQSVMLFVHMEVKKHSSAINKNNTMCLFLSSTHHQAAVLGCKCEHRNWCSQWKRW